LFLFLFFFVFFFFCQKLRSNQDPESARLVDKLCSEEVAHVRAGVRWFRHFCALRGHSDPVAHFHALMRALDIRFAPPFNERARAETGMTREWYEPLRMVHDQARRSDGSRGSRRPAGELAGE
jgi:uncharacterized ferritin-like protein (DUF455 family)